MPLICHLQLAMRAGGDQYIALANCDAANRVVGIIDATKPAAVIMNWTTAQHVWLRGVITTTLWSALTTGKWTIYITYIDYTNI